MAKFLIVRHELAVNALGAIKALYAPLIVDVQAAVDGDGKTLATIHWGAYTPRFELHAEGYLRQWSKQIITLELRASVDYRNRALSPKYLKLLQAFEDFCARNDLTTWLTSAEEDGIIVEEPPTFEGCSEDVQDGTFVTAYSLRVAARGKVNGA